MDFVCEDANQGAADSLEMDRDALVGSLLSQVLPDETGNTLIAEGVETPGECATLYRLGMPLAQGYLFGRPEPATGQVGP